MLGTPLMRREKRLKYSTIGSEVDSFPINWQGKEFIVKLTENGVDDRLIRMVGDQPLGWRSIEVVAHHGESNHHLLNFLSVYLGEDVFPVRDISDRERPDLRGTIAIDPIRLQQFLSKADAWTTDIQSNKWRGECAQTAFGYFCGAIEMGLELTPATPGIFAICIEVIANAWNFSPSQHMKFRGKGGPEDMYRTITDNAIREAVLADVALLYNLRNKTGSHFSLHIERDRMELVGDLRQWMIRRGCTKEFSEISFTLERLPEELQVNGPSLYKTALTIARLGFYILVDAVELFHVADRDLRA